MPYEIEIINQQTFLPINESGLKQIIVQTLTHQQISNAVVNLLLVDNATIHGINLAHLQHDFATDVITFPMNDEDSPPPQHPLEGEIVISAEMAIEMAESIGWKPEYELQLYLIHGLLHLCGYDDLEESLLLQMRQQELEMLKRVNIPVQHSDPRWEGLSVLSNRSSSNV